MFSFYKEYHFHDTIFRFPVVTSPTKPKFIFHENKMTQVSNYEQQ